MTEPHRQIKIETAVLAEPPDFSGVETVTLTRDEIMAQRQAILDRYGLAEKDIEAAECGCCPASNYIPWVAFSDWRTLNWLLGDDR